MPMYSLHISAINSFSQSQPSNNAKLCVSITDSQRCLNNRQCEQREDSTNNASACGISIQMRQAPACGRRTQGNTSLPSCVTPAADSLRETSSGRSPQGEVPHQGRLLSDVDVGFLEEEEQSIDKIYISFCFLGGLFLLVCREKEEVQIVKARWWMPKADSSLRQGK